MAIKTYFEWTVEFINEDDDIFDSDFSETLGYFSDHLGQLAKGNNHDEEGNRIDLGLVVTDTRGRRSWAYLWMDGDTLKLPDYSEDSGGVDVKKIPKRFHDELARELRKLNKVTK